MRGRVGGALNTLVSAANVTSMGLAGIAAAAEQLADLETTKTEMQQRLDQIETNLRAYADSV